MTELRSKYPQAKAWTFVLPDTPPSTGTASSRSVPAGGGDCGHGSTEPEVAKKQQHQRKRKDSGKSVEMGSLCSSAKSVANKENMEEASDQDLIGDEEGKYVSGGATDGAGAPTVVAGKTPAGLKGCSGREGAERPAGSEKGEGKVVNNGHAGYAEGMLDSTAFLSPDTVPAASVEGKLCNEGEDGAFFEVEQGGTDDDRSAWLARNLALLRGGRAIDVGALKQLSGLEDCLHDLLSDRARHLKAMETLTEQLRRKEADVERGTHDIKALTSRLECLEQDKTSLEHRARAAAEEHRGDRGRWFVHKQELETRCVQLENRDGQYRAAIRKKEVEYGKLQDNMRRIIQKDSRTAGGRGGVRGMETSLDLSPKGQAQGESPLGGLINRQTRRKVEDLERENASLRSMLVDLQADVVDLKDYHDRHGDLVSAGRADDSIWGGATDDPLPSEVIEGMSAEWLQRKFGKETARQILGMRGALSRVLGDGGGGGGGDDVSEADLAGLVSQLGEARALLREQDGIMLAAIFDRPSAEMAICSNRQRCGNEVGENGTGSSGEWDTRERLEQDREELERARAKLEKDKAMFLEEAVRRDKQSFVFAYSPSTPVSPYDAGAGGREAGSDSLRTPGHGSCHHRHLSATGTLMVPRSPAFCGVRGAGLPLMTFTPPGASPDTARLLGEIGIRPGGRDETKGYC